MVLKLTPIHTRFIKRIHRLEMIIQKTLNTYKSTILAFPRAMQITFLLQCSHYRESTVMIKMVPESVKEGNRRLNKC